MKKVIKEIFDQERYKRALENEARNLIVSREMISAAYGIIGLTEEEHKALTEKVQKQDFLIDKKEFLLHKITLDSNNDVVFIVSELDGRNFQHIKAEDCTIIEVEQKETKH